MNARMLAPAAMAALLSGGLPARAADPQMLALVMPDAKVLAGINVQQAMATPFGQFILAQMAPQSQQIQNLATLLGFDPRKDVLELLVASNGSSNGTGLSLARGAFNPAQIASAALADGAKSETYAGLTILENAQQTAGVAFPDATLAVLGSVANVKAAIDRLQSPTTLPANLAALVAQWSLSQDAWAVSLVSPAGLQAPAGATQIPGLAQLAGSPLIQQAAGGIKFGSTILVTAQAQTDTAQNATTLAGVVQFLQNLAQAQAAQNGQTAALLKSLAVTAQGNTVSFSLAVPEAQVEALIQSKPAAGSGRGAGSAAPRVPPKKVI